MLISNAILEQYAMRRDRNRTALKAVVGELDDFTIVNDRIAIWDVDERFLIKVIDGKVMLVVEPRPDAPRDFPTHHYEIGRDVVSDVARNMLEHLTPGEIADLAERPETRLDEEFGVI